MKGIRFIVLLTSFYIVICSYGQITPDCSFITDNYSGQITTSRCAPLTITMETEYKFMFAVDPAQIEILYIWNDGTGAQTTVQGISQGDTIFTANESHLYLPSDQCSYTAEAFIIANGEICTSSSRQEQTFSAWSTDNLNSGELYIEPPEALICEGFAVDTSFSDQSTFNCNVGIEPDKPNQMMRWVQFVYNTDPTSLTLIPNTSVIDPLGNVYPLTDASGNSINTQYGPIITVPMPANGPNQDSWQIVAPPGGIDGDYIEITMRNWNICNPYDNDPFDGIDPADTINGHNAPIETTAYVRIVTTPAIPTIADVNVCLNEDILLSTGTGNIVSWYSDSLLNNLLYNGINFYPTQPPINLDNSVPGTYDIYVTDRVGLCESAPNHITLTIFDDPTIANAGPDQFICVDSSVLQGNNPFVGTGVWTTTSGATIENPNDPNSSVSNLDIGANEFTWTITNGPCISTDVVSIYRDLQPDPADAGIDTSFCDASSLQLNATSPTNGGIGEWSIIQGSGILIDSSQNNTILTNISQGITSLVWTVESTNGGCISSNDTIDIIRDIAPNNASAGPDQIICESDITGLTGNIVTANGTGYWSLISGSAVIGDQNNPLTNISSITYGTNRLEWRIESELGICPVTRDTIQISRYEMPDQAVAGSDQLLCSVLRSDTLNGNIPIIGNGYWQVLTAPSGATPVFLPNNTTPDAVLQISAGYEGLYELTWNIINGPCSTVDTVVIDFGVSIPPANAGPDQEVCALSTTLNADIPVIGTGTWSIISGNGSPVFSDINDPNTTISVDQGDEGVYELSWFTYSGSCIPLPVHTDTVLINLKPVPETPLNTDVSRCGDGSMNVSLNKPLNATTIRWYDDGAGTNLLEQDTIFASPVLDTNQRYYISGYNDTALCESPLVPIDLIINQIPDPPISSDVQNCGQSSLTLNALVGLNGTGNRWYENETDSIPITSGSQFSTPVIQNSRSYWVTSYNATTLCESNKSEVEITIDSIPLAPLVQDTSRCNAGSLELFAGTGLYGTTNRWYNQSSGGILLATSPTYITNHLTKDTSYFISSYNSMTQCESERTEMTVTIYDRPEEPVIADTSICGYDTLILSGQVGNNGTTLRWYNMPGGSGILSTGLSYETPYLTSTTAYWISSYNEITGCESPRNQMDVTIREIPQTTPIQGYEFVRQDQVNVVYSVDYHTGSVYDWNIPLEVMKINEVDNFVILGFPNLGSQIISVMETASNGCPGEPEEKEIVVTNDLITLNIDNRDIETCHGDNIILNIVPEGGNAPFFYSWSGDSSYLSETDRSNPVFLASEPGNYRLRIHVWDIDNNHAFDTMLITVNSNPQITFDPDFKYVCAGSDYAIIPNVTGGSFDYNLFMWTGNTVGLSSISSPAPIFNATFESTYEMILTVRDSKSCFGKDTLVLENVLPEASFTTDAVPSCSPAVFNFNNTSEDATNYKWSFDDGQSSVDTNVSHTYYNKETSVKYYEVVLTAYDEHNCSSNAKTFVTVYPNPDHSFTISPDSGCNPVQAILSSTPGGYNYIWNFGDGDFENSNYSTYHEFINTGDDPKEFNISLIATTFFGCLDTFYNSLTVYPSPKAEFIATPESQIFPNSTVNITGVPDGDYEYYWDFGDDITSTDQNPGSHNYMYNGNYVISLKMVGAYCEDSIEKRINILPAEPIAKFKKIEPGCMPHTIHFENQSQYAETFLWEFGDGAISNKPNPVYTYYEAGVYKIKLTATSKEGLQNTASDVGTVFVLPNSFFDLAPKIVFVNDEPVHYFNLSDYGDSYLWDFGDGETSTDFEAEHIYKSAGSYDVTLTVMTDQGCYDFYEMKSAVLVEESGKVVFPNVIKPYSNIDQNQSFKPAIIDEVEEYHLMIYNRWGELIFETNDQYEGWDGNFKGSPVKSDVYVWRLKGKYVNGRPLDLTGDVTVIY